MPFISVVLCTYGRDLLALRAIKSVLATDYQDYDLIVVGQGQRGGLEQRLQQELGPCPPLRYVHCETIGLSQARNLGVAHSDAEVVVFLDDDARALPGWLSSYAEAFSGEPSPAMVGGRLVPEWEARRPRWYPSSRLSQLGLYDIGDHVVPFPEHDLPVGANFAVRRRALLDVGGFDNELGFKAGQRTSLGGEDSLVARRVKQRGGLILYHPGAAVEHRVSREKVRLRSFVKRSFVEGRTQIAILSRVSTSTRAYFRGVMRWHAVALLRAPLHLLGQLRKGRLPGLEPLGELAAAVFLSAGVIFESWLCLRRAAPGGGSARPRPAVSKSRSYGDDWDVYVANWKAHARLEPTNKERDDLVYPGDEWGRPEEWRAHAERFLMPYLPEQGVAVELGPGSGKYSLLVVERASRLVCFDVSRRFMEIARARLAGHVESGRVSFELLSLSDCNEITQRLERRGLVGRVDLFFSVDSMQHVELHTFLAYLVAASACLRTGGHISMTVASCTTDQGFARLVQESAYYYGGSRAGHQFYFLSHDIVEALIARLGFELVDYHEARDTNFAARKLRDSGVTLVSV